MAWTNTPNIKLPVNNEYGGSWLTQWATVMNSLDFIIGEPITPLVAGANIIDASGIYRYHRSPVGNCTVTFESIAVAEYFPGATMKFRQTDAGVITFVAGSGVTINPAYGATTLVTRGPGDTVLFKCVSRNVWDMIYLGGGEAV